MAKLPMVQNPNHPLTHFPLSLPNPITPISPCQKTPQMALQSITTNRRTTTLHIIASTSILFLSSQAIFTHQMALAAFDFSMTTPDQTLEEAETGLSGHAQSLLHVKELLEEQSWKEAQKVLRKSSSYLKQDIYTIIQAKPGSERPLLRKLYSVLFNGVTRLDYAARDKDQTRIWDCYDNVVVALNDILSRL